LALISPASSGPVYSCDGCSVAFVSQEVAISIYHEGVYAPQSLSQNLAALDIIQENISAMLII
jgi:hypothetical protein